MIARLLTGLVVVASVALAGCGDNASPASPPVTAIASPGGIVVSASTATVAFTGEEAEEVDVTGPATDLTITALPAGALALLDASAASGPAPSVTTGAHTVSVAAPVTGAVTVRLRPHVAWAVHLNGGAATTNLDLRSVDLAGLVAGASLGTATLTLGTPADTVAVDLHAATGPLAVHLAPGVRAVLRVTSVGTVTIDGSAQYGGSGTTTFPVAGTSVGAYSVVVAGGAPQVVLDHLA